MPGKRELGGRKETEGAMERELRVASLVGEIVCKYLEGLPRGSGTKVKEKLVAKVHDPEIRAIVRQDLELVDLILTSRGDG